MGAIGAGRVACPFYHAEQCGTFLPAVRMVVEEENSCERLHF